MQAVGWHRPSLCSLIPHRLTDVGGTTDSTMGSAVWQCCGRWVRGGRPDRTSELGLEGHHSEGPGFFPLGEKRSWPPAVTLPGSQETLLSLSGCLCLVPRRGLDMDVLSLCVSEALTRVHSLQMGGTSGAKRLKVWSGWALLPPPLSRASRHCLPLSLLPGLGQSVQGWETRSPSLLSGSSTWVIKNVMVRVTCGPLTCASATLPPI